MAQRELSIIANARITLNDVKVDNPRWTTERLMGFLNEAQDTMCKGIPLLTNKVTINTVVGQDTYRLPTDSIKLLRASSEGIPLTITSYDEIEEAIPDWEEDTASSFRSVIVNALSQQEIRPYPLTSVSKPIKARYHMRPVALGWDTTALDSMEELSISDMWDEGLKQFIIGQAFLDYGDEASNSRASTALGLFKTEYAQALKLSKSSFSKRVRTTGYQAKVASLNYGGRHGSGNCRFGY